MEKNLDKEIDEGEDGDEVIDLPTFDLSTIMKATANFSDDNKLGEGGFGTVYKVKIDVYVAKAALQKSY